MQSKQFKYCKNCSYFHYDSFCGYDSRYCYIHGHIDCNPDSYITTVLEKENINCPDFITPEDFKIKYKKEIEEERNNIDIVSINKTVEEIINKLC